MRETQKPAQRQANNRAPCSSLEVSVILHTLLPIKASCIKQDSGKVMQYAFSEPCLPKVLWVLFRSRLGLPFGTYGMGTIIGL